MDFPRDTAFTPSAAGADEPASEQTALLAFVSRTTVALAGCVDEHGSLACSSGEAARGAPWAALALALYELADERWRALIRDWTTGPADRRRPSDRLALLLLRDVLQRRSALTGDDAAVMRRALAKRVRPRRGDANHQVLLAETADLLLAADGSPRQAAARRFAALCERWTTPAGGFIDAPTRPSSQPAAGKHPQTPVDAHAVFLLALVLVSLGATEAEQPEHLARGLGWLLAFTDEAGRAGGFGRGGHSLSGYAAMLAVFVHGTSSAPDERSRRRWALGAKHVRVLLEERRREDGLLSADLGGDGEAPAGLESNAWTAGLLAWMLAAGPGPGVAALPAPDVSALGTRPEELAYDERAGLAALRGPRGLAWLSLAGQPVAASGGLLGSPGHATAGADFAEFRAASVLTWHLVLDGQARLAPPMQVPIETLTRHPACAGWVPVVSKGGRLHALMAEQGVVLAAEAGHVVVAGRAVPVVLGATRPRARASALDDHVAWRALVVDAEQGWCATVLLLDGNDSDARLLNPHGRALLEAGTRLPLRLSRWSESDGASRPRVRGMDRVTCPSSLGPAHVACEGLLGWPQQRLALITVLGPSGAETSDELPVHYDGALRRLVLPWGTVPLG